MFRHRDRFRQDLSGGQPIRRLLQKAEEFRVVDWMQSVLPLLRDQVVAHLVAVSAVLPGDADVGPPHRPAIDLAGRQRRGGVRADSDR
jgi:hypothetical protein